MEEQNRCWGQTWTLKSCVNYAHLYRRTEKYAYLIELVLWGCDTSKRNVFQLKAFSSPDSKFLFNWKFISKQRDKYSSEQW